MSNPLEECADAAKQLKAQPETEPQNSAAEFIALISFEVWEKFQWLKKK